MPVADTTYSTALKNLGAWIAWLEAKDREFEDQIARARRKQPAPVAMDDSPPPVGHNADDEGEAAPLWTGMAAEEPDEAIPIPEEWPRDAPDEASGETATRPGWTRGRRSAG